MSDQFRELLCRVGSGTHTSEALSRTEAKAALKMMLLQDATPAQIGAFLISHRIRRPTGEEIAGMLDAYDELGPKLAPVSTPAFVLGCPFDGRSRTAPITPITALILTATGVPVIMHGGQRMPTKEGLPFIEIWQGLGVDWTNLSFAQVQTVFETTGLGFVYLPNHFPLAEGLVSYRREIGKRPPLATMELIWCPYSGVATVVGGYVHPPTEMLFQEAFQLRGTSSYITVKGLEGSCDLPRDRTCIIGLHQGSQLERLLLHPRDYGMDGKEVPLVSSEALIQEMQGIFAGKDSELMQAAIWNGGFYLWRAGVCEDLNTGLSKAKALLSRGEVATQLQKIRNAVQGNG